MNRVLPNERSNWPLDVVPADVVATPADVRLTEDDEPTWWTPGWQDVRRFVGWRWVLAVPAFLCIGIAVGGWVYYPMRGAAIAVAAQLGIVVFGLGLGLLGYVTRLALKARSEPFCIYCGYSLSGLPDDYRCPECGRAYTWALIEEYRKDPFWFRQRWKQRQQLPPPATAFPSGSVPRRRRAEDGTE